MRGKTAVWIMMLTSGLLYAQNTDSVTVDSLNAGIVNNLDKMVVTATRHEKKAFECARSVTVVDQKELTAKNQFSALDALDDQIGVWIEKRTVTSSDPIIRGLSGGNVLALVDGNNFSTFWGEGGFAGDDMYGKIDAESIDRIEVVRGPSSVMYGSNALGGVINFISKQSPLLFTENGFMLGGRIKGASESASDYLMGRAETWGATPKLRYFVGATTHRSGNMRAGDNCYIIPSGGKDWSVDLNSEVKLNPNNFLMLKGQFIDRPEIYRSYRPTQSNENIRSGVNLGYRSVTPGLFSDLLTVNLYHQYKNDIRYWYASDKLQKLTDEGYAWWHTFSVDVQSNKQLFKGNTLIAGLNYHLDIGESPDDEQFTMKTDDGEQKAAPGNRWHNGGVFLHDEWDIGTLLTVTAGVRYDYFRFITDNDTFYTLPGSTDPEENVALTDSGDYTKHTVTGGASLMFHFTDRVNVAASWTRGFRMVAPSFGFRQTGQGVLVPNGFLDPITADLFELSPRLRAEALEATLTGYYTKFTNFQQPIHGEYKGDTAIDYNKNDNIEPDERVYVNTADGDAYVAGVELEIDLSLGALIRQLDGFHIIGGGMYNYGRMKFPGEDEMYLRHTHPLRGIFKLKYDEPSPANRWWGELCLDAVDRYDEIDKERLNSDVGYLKNPQDPTSGLYRPYGLPSYYVVDIRAGFRFSSNVLITMGIENLFDRDYRTAHSRMDAKGRGVQMGLDVSF